MTIRSHRSSRRFPHGAETRQGLSCRPTRPPAETWVEPPDEQVVNRAFQTLNRKVERVELLTGYEGNAFACTGDVVEDLLEITAVHPMREEVCGNC